MRFLREVWAYLHVLPRAKRNRADLVRFLIRRPALAVVVGAHEAAWFVTNRVEPRLKALASLRVSSMIGCPF